MTLRPQEGKNPLVLHCLKKNPQKLSFQWIFVDGVEWKSFIFDISMKYDVHSTSSTNIHWKFNFSWYFSISVSYNDNSSTNPIVNHLTIWPSRSNIVLTRPAVPAQQPQLFWEQELSSFPSHNAQLCSPLGFHFRFLPLGLS